MRCVMLILIGLLMLASTASAGTVMTKPQYGLVLDGSSDDIAYLESVRTDTPEAYQAFIDGYPTSENATRAFGKMVRGTAGLPSFGPAIQRTGVCKDGSCQLW